MSGTAIRAEDEMPWMNWCKGLLSPQPRKTTRPDSPAVVAYYWNGGAPQICPVRDISAKGFYMFTEERWYPGTMLMVTLERTDMLPGTPQSLAAVQARVPRNGDDGVAFALVPSQTSPKTSQPAAHYAGVDSRRLGEFLKRIPSTNAQALIEYILVLPLVFILIMNVVNFGGFFFAWITVANASRAAADYAIMGGATVGAPVAPTATPINSVITQDVSSLLNRSSVIVNICQNYSGTITTLSGTCTSVPADPEPATYTLTSIDVTYSYVPFIPAGFQFKNLNIYVTLPPSTVHRRAVMRLMQ